MYEAPSNPRSYPQANAESHEPAPVTPDSFVGLLNKITDSKRAGVPVTPAFGVGVTLSSLHSAQIASQEGEFVMIDMEHSPLSPERVMHIVHAIVAASGGKCFPLIRIPSSGVEWIKWALDSGAAGIIIPMVENASDMRDIINKALYPPRGSRSFGPALPAFGAPGSRAKQTMKYFERAKAGHIAILPMIESAKGVKNVEEILGVEGVSGAFVGPVDLRLSLGLSPALDGDEATFKEALGVIRRAADRLGKPLGTVAIGPTLIRKRTKDGMSFMVVSVDTSLLQSGFEQSVMEAREAVKSECPRAGL